MVVTEITEALDVADRRPSRSASCAATALRRSLLMLRDRAARRSALASACVKRDTAVETQPRHGQPRRVLDVRGRRSRPTDAVRTRTRRSRSCRGSRAACASAASSSRSVATRARRPRSRCGSRPRSGERPRDLARSLVIDTRTKASLGELEARRCSSTPNADAGDASESKRLVALRSAADQILDVLKEKRRIVDEQGAPRASASAAAARRPPVARLGGVHDAVSSAGGVRVLVARRAVPRRRGGERDDEGAARLPRSRRRAARRSRPCCCASRPTGSCGTCASTSAATSRLECIQQHPLAAPARRLDDARQPASLRVSLHRVVSAVSPDDRDGATRCYIIRHDALASRCARRDRAHRRAGACTKPQPPQLTPKEAKVTSVDITGFDMRVKMDAFNPNGFALSVRSVVAHVIVDGTQDLGTVTASQPINLPANAHTLIDVPMNVKWKGVGGLASIARREAARALHGRRHGERRRRAPQRRRPVQAAGRRSPPSSSSRPR